VLSFGRAVCWAVVLMMTAARSGVWQNALRWQLVRYWLINHHPSSSVQYSWLVDLAAGGLPLQLFLPDVTVCLLHRPASLLLPANSHELNHWWDISKERRWMIIFLSKAVSCRWKCGNACIACHVSPGAMPDLQLPPPYAGLPN